MSNKTTSPALLDPSIVFPAIKDAFIKLDPRQLIRNPVIFVTEVVAAFVSAIFIRDLIGGGNEAVTAGLSLVARSIGDVLTSVGIEEIEASGVFDPNMHHAIVHIDDPTLPENSIAEVLQKGYKYKDIVIRHAMVKVAN